MASRLNMCNWEVPKPLEEDDKKLFRYLADYSGKAKDDRRLNILIKQDPLLKDAIYHLAMKYGLSRFSGPCEQKYPDAYYSLQYNNPYLPPRPERVKKPVPKLGKNHNVSGIRGDSVFA